VVNLHGAGATGREQEALTNYDAVADAHRFIVVYPDGIDFSWADGRGPSQPDRQGIDDVGFITALVAKLVADFGVDPGHVFATGMSAGAFMVNRLACDRADVFAAIAPVAGTLGVNAGCAPSRPVAVLATHGTADPIVPFAGGSMNGRGGTSIIVAAPAIVTRWRQADGCQDNPAADGLPSTGDGSGVQQFTSSACAPGTAVVFKQVDGGGHTWPGDAAEASWQFFAGHSR
jgi:polyhydroxybutyrate depolymerase